MESLRLTILYASQTGTAEDFAEKLWRQARHRNVSTLLQNFDDFGAKNLIGEKFVVFICATTGAGDEPDNMKISWRFLRRRNLPVDSLAGIKFAILGLGDSSYPKFNFVAKKLFRRLRQLSAVNFMQIGLADDQHEFGPDSVADSWIDELWSKLSIIYPAEIRSPAADDDFFPAKFKAVFVERAYDISATNTQDINLVEDQQLPPYIAELLENRRLTPEHHFQDTRLIRLDIGQNPNPNILSYNPGDIVVVQPANLDESIEMFMQICDRLSYERPFLLESLDDRSFSVPPKFILPQPCTFLHCINRYFDLQTVPRLSFFENLLHFAVDEREREKLTEFISKESRQDLYSYCNRPRRSVVEVLRDFPQTAKRVPLERWFDLLNPIRPRCFSIASSPQVHSGEIHILLAVVKYKTILAAPRLGLCSNWLARLKPGHKIPIWVRRGSFVWDSKKDFEPIPRLMIGPGTGVAPFRSMIHTRSYSSAAWRENATNLDVLFFGCRNESADFYFQDEWTDLELRKCLKYFVAFSRDSDKKVYVQHKIRENSEFVAKLIMERNCHVFVAGNSKLMPEDVLNSLKFAVKQVYDLNQQTVDDIFVKLEKENRYQTETWS